MIINKKDDITHMTIGAAVINEIGLCHSIVYEINDLCKYARNENLSVFVHSFHAQTYLKVFLNSLLGRKTRKLS